MAYNNNKGPQHTGDIQFEGDPDETQIDFENDSIALKTGGANRVIVNNTGLSGSGTLQNVGPTILGDTLAVSGTVSVTGDIVHAGDTDTYLRFNTNTVNLVAGNKSAIKLDASQAQIRLNDGAENLDTQIIADNGAVILHADAGTNKVGINTVLLPSEALTVIGNISGSGTFQTVGATTLGNTLNVSGTVQAAQAITSSMGIHITGSNPKLSLGDVGDLTPNGGMLFIRPSDTSNRALCLMQSNESEGNRVIFAVTGSGQVLVGGGHFGGVLSVSGSTAENLISAKSDTANTAFTVRGNGDTSVSGSLTVSGSVRGKQLDMHTHKANISATTRHYVRFDGAGADSTLGFNNFMVAPYSGKLIKLVVRSDQAAGTAGASFHRGVDGDANINTTPIDSVVNVDMSSARTAYTFNFTDASNYGPGDIVGIAFSGSSAPGNIVLHSVWEHDQNS